MSASLQAMQQRFSIPGLSIQPGLGGLIRAVISTDAGSGELYLSGAHVTAWQPAGQQPVLWMSEKSAFEIGRPIRGGVPICFPWFGAHPSDTSAPAHGTVRVVEWNLTDADCLNDGGIRLGLATEIFPFQLQLHAEFTSLLQMTLTVLLPTSAQHPATFEEALHTYLSVGDIHQVHINGLESAGYLDKVGEPTERPATGTPILFSGETDRVYLNTGTPCVLHDPVLKRSITVGKSGSASTVIWNPWIEKSARMPDFGDDEWQQMLCIETANVAGSAIQLYPGQSHSMTAVIEVTSDN